MPLQIQRTATVYRLWDDDDVHALFEDHAAAGWLCTLTCMGDGSGLTWQVSLQNSAARQVITAPTSSVVVSDQVTVQAQTVAEYNAANPGNTIEGQGS